MLGCAAAGLASSHKGGPHLANGSGDPAPGAVIIPHSTLSLLCSGWGRSPLWASGRSHLNMLPLQGQQQLLRKGSEHVRADGGRAWTVRGPYLGSEPFQMTVLPKWRQALWGQLGSESHDWAPFHKNRCLFLSLLSHLRSTHSDLLMQGVHYLSDD